MDLFKTFLLILCESVLNRNGRKGKTAVFPDGQMFGKNSASIYFIMKTPILYVCYTPNLILRKADQGQEAQPVPDLLFAYKTVDAYEISLWKYMKISQKQ